MDNLRKYHTSLNRLLLAQMYRTEAYKKASEASVDAKLKSFFKDNARIGKKFIEDISLMINPLLITETEDTDLPPHYQRTWEALPDILFGESKNTILDQYLSGENLSFQLYTEVLGSEDEFPSLVRDVLLSQREIIRYTIEEMKEMKVSKLNFFLRKFTQFRRFFFQRRIQFQ